MGRQTIWDGRGFPEVGDDVEFDVASTPVVQVGKVVRFEVARFNQAKLNCWRIEVHMTCCSTDGEWPQMRLLEEIRPLTSRIGKKQ